MTGNFGNWTTISYIFYRFSAACAETAKILLSGQIFNPKFEISMGCFLSTTNFGGVYYKIDACCEQKQLL